jgi:hypothetical protein
MSYAWNQLEYAIKALAGSSEQRARLVRAYNNLVKLKAKDLPAEVSADLDKLVGSIPRYPAKNLRREIKTEVNSLTDAEIVEAINLITNMHDAVAIYQPRPSQHAWASNLHP